MTQEDQLIADIAYCVDDLELNDEQIGHFFVHPKSWVSVADTWQRNLCLRVKHPKSFTDYTLTQSILKSTGG